MPLNKKKIVVKVEELSIAVYDEVESQRLDLFANDEEGKQQAVKVVKELLGV